MWQARGGSAWTCVACDGASSLARRPCDGLLYAPPWYLEFYTIISVRHARVRLGGALREGARRAGSLVAISAPELDPANHRQVIFDDPGRLDARDATSQHRPEALLEHDGIDAPQPPLLLDPEREQPERANSSSGEKELQPAQGKQAPSRGGDGLVEVAQGHEEADRLARAVRVADFR